MIEEKKVDAGVAASGTINDNIINSNLQKM